MPDLRDIHPRDSSAEALLNTANLGPGEYLSAVWNKGTKGKGVGYGGTVRVDITTNTAEKLAYIRQMTQSRSCTDLHFVVTTRPDLYINPQSDDGLTRIYFFGA